jgi:hypothetical protein
VERLPQVGEGRQHAFGVTRHQLRDAERSVRLPGGWLTNHFAHASIIDVNFEKLIDMSLLTSNRPKHWTNIGKHSLHQLLMFWPKRPRL